MYANIPFEEQNESRQKHTLFPSRLFQDFHASQFLYPNVIWVVMLAGRID